MINKVCFQGRFVADPELKQTSTGIDFTEFTVAWSNKYKESEQKCFLRCKAWRNNAEFITKYFNKGKEVVIEGNLVTESWEKDGKPQSRTILSVEKAHFCGSNGSGNEQKTASAPDIDSFINAEADSPFNFN